MKALIMAAGRGTRISRYIEGKPKCTLDIGGIQLIEHTVKELLTRGIQEIGIVLGYKADVIEEILSEYPVKFYYNYFYEVTNSIASAWFAKEFIDDDMIIMNADVFSESEIMTELLKMEKEIVLLSDSSKKEFADYKLYYEDNQLIKFGKDLKGEDITGEYVGIAKISKLFTKEFTKRLNELVKTGNYNMWWEDVLYSFVGEKLVYVHDVEGKFWAEVDFVEDYERILGYRGYNANYNITVEKNL